MESSPEYSEEKVHGAVFALATGRWSLLERLQEAWISGLHALDSHPIPWPDLAETFEVDIAVYFKLDPKSGRQIVETTSIDDQSKLARRIWDLDGAIKRRREMTAPPQAPR